MSQSATHPVVGVPPLAPTQPQLQQQQSNAFFLGRTHIVASRRAKEVQGMPGTTGGLALRLSQFSLAVAAFTTMVCIKDFNTVTAFCYLVAATVLQSVWSLGAAILDVYALLFQRSLRRRAVVTLLALGDWITATLTLAAACSSAGITVLIGKDLDQCGPNHCGKFEAAVTVTFFSWFFASLSFFLSFWLLATN